MKLRRKVETTDSLRLNNTSTSTAAPDTKPDDNVSEVKVAKPRKRAQRATNSPAKVVKSESPDVAESVNDNVLEDSVGIKATKTKYTRVKDESVVVEANSSGMEVDIDFSCKLDPAYEKDRNSLSTLVAKSCKFLGAHVSGAGGLENALINAASIGCRALAMFVRNGRTWKVSPLEDVTIQRFKAACNHFGYTADRIVVHGSYLLNCGAGNDDVLQKSRDVMIEEVRRCEALGITYYNFHPGSSTGLISKEDSIKRIAESINIVHGQTKSVIMLIENMAGTGHHVGSRFEELKSIIDLVADHSRIGVCLDTCHAFAAGFDMRTPEGYEDMMVKFDQIIGLGYFKAVHLNDSKGDVGCCKDRHENVGKGKIGLMGLANLMKDKRMDGIPIILETPECNYAREMITLHELEN